MAGAPGAAGDMGGAGEAGAPVIMPPEPPKPPVITGMKPLTGPYGTEVRITGTDLGSAARSGVNLLIGADGELELDAERPEIVSWSETEIRFRFPFPYEGRVLLRTPQGEQVAGEFEPTWVAGPTIDSSAGVTSVASISEADGSIAAVLDTAPPSLVTFDGSDWLETAISGKNLRRDSIRLYLDGARLAAYALSTTTSPELIALDPQDDFAQTPSGVKVTTDYHAAGAPEGAALWWRTGNNWFRARPSAGVWATDKGPIGDPNTGGANHVAAAAADGSLFVGWSEDVGTTFDDLGAAYHRRLLPDSMAWQAKQKTGSDMEDAISSFTMLERGSGVVARYCGTNEDPFGVTGDDRLCYSALLPTGTKASVRETTTLRYGIGANVQAAVYCSDQGLRLLPDLGSGGTTYAALDAIGGDVVAWPCPNVVALEIDAADEALLIVEAGGKLYGPRPRVR